MLTGWLNLNGKYYYLNPSNSGRMVASTTMTIDGISYTFDSSGAYQSNNYGAPTNKNSITNSPVNNNSNNVNNYGPGGNSSYTPSTSPSSPSGSSTTPGGSSSGNHTTLVPGMTGGPG